MIKIKTFIVIFAVVISSCNSKDEQSSHEKTSVNVNKSKKGLVINKKMKLNKVKIYNLKGSSKSKLVNNRDISDVIDVIKTNSNHFDFSYLVSNYKRSTTKKIMDNSLETVYKVPDSYRLTLYFPANIRVLGFYIYNGNWSPLYRMGKHNNSFYDYSRIKKVRLRIYQFGWSDNSNQISDKVYLYYDNVIKFDDSISPIKVMTLPMAGGEYSNLIKKPEFDKKLKWLITLYKLEVIEVYKGKEEPSLCITEINNGKFH